MTVCKRCGRCCRLIINGVLREDVKCPHLVILKSGKTLCRVYKTRLGRKLNSETECYLRKDIPLNYPDCPFNKSEWGDAF